MGYSCTIGSVCHITDSQGKAWGMIYTQTSSKVSATMDFIQRAADAPIKLKLNRDRTRLLKQGYPWIYRDWLEEAPPARAGSRAMVKDRDGSLIAFGFYDPDSPLAVRVCAVEQERLGDELVQDRLQQAHLLRRSQFDTGTSGYRLINGEGDGLPGLVCDIYGKQAVLKLDGAGPAGFWELQGIGSWLRDTVGVEGVFLKNRAGGEERGVAILGKEPPTKVKFLENRLHFQADIVWGQKTGFFLDQRDNRARIGKWSKDRSVLNLFAYTGGFSIYAGKGGARSVTTVDLAKPAIEEARCNWELNALPEQQHELVAADVFDFLDQAKRAGRSWDLVVVDPPSFAPAQKHLEKARESYIKLFAAALQVVNPNGIAALSSCSSHISPEIFAELCQGACSKARRRARVIGVYGQPADHPFPITCSELQYLKFNLLSV